jgi:hypothetical protein
MKRSYASAEPAKLTTLTLEGARLEIPHDLQARRGRCFALPRLEALPQCGCSPANGQQLLQYDVQLGTPSPAVAAQLPQQPLGLSLPLAPLPALTGLVAVLVIRVHDAS